MKKEYTETLTHDYFPLLFSTYSLDVICPTKSKPLAKFALNPYPIHDTMNGMDLSLIHLKDEDAGMCDYVFFIQNCL